MVALYTLASARGHGEPPAGPAGVGDLEFVGVAAENAPGPRVVVAIEGTRSYGAGLARALTEAGLTVIECEQPTRTTRRGRGKSDAIDAHLAVLWAVQLDAELLPSPRADGDREALRVLLTAREELPAASTLSWSVAGSSALTSSQAPQRACCSVGALSVNSTLTEPPAGNRNARIGSASPGPLRLAAGPQPSTVAKHHCSCSFRCGGA